MSSFAAMIPVGDRVAFSFVPRSILLLFSLSNRPIHTTARAYRGRSGETVRGNNFNISTSAVAKPLGMTIFPSTCKPAHSETFCF
jgi:hypothetical protein